MLPHIIVYMDVWSKRTILSVGDRRSTSSASREFAGRGLNMCKHVENCKSSKIHRTPRHDIQRMPQDAIHRMSSTGSDSFHGLLSTGCDPQDAIYRRLSTERSTTNGQLVNACMLERLPLIANQPRFIMRQSAKIPSCRASIGSAARWPQAQQIFRTHHHLRQSIHPGQTHMSCGKWDFQSLHSHFEVRRFFPVSCVHFSCGCAVL